jgi:hypothetical protein
MGNLSPIRVSLKKLCNFKANFSYPVFCTTLWLVPFWALTFEKIQGHCCSRDQPNTVCLHCIGLARPLFAFSGLAPLFFAFSGLVHLIFIAYFYTGTSSGSNPAACCDDFFPGSCQIHTCTVVQDPEMKSSSFCFRKNQSMLGPSPLFAKIPDSVPADVKTLLQKFPSILRTGDVKPTPTLGVEHHIHTGSHPLFFAKSRCLDWEKLQVA